MKIHFLLSRPNSDQPTAIKLRFHFNGQFVFGTGILINPRHWDFENQRAFEGTRIPIKDRKHDPRVEIRLSDINTIIRTLSNEIIDKVNHHRKHKTPLNFDSLKPKLKAIAKPDIIKSVPQSKEVDKPIFLLPYFKRVVSEMDKGLRTFEGKLYAKSTIKGYRQFVRFWEAYEKKYRKKIRFDDVDSKLYDHFSRYCRDLNLRQNYIGRRIKELKVMMTHGYKEGIHNNRKYEEFKVLKTTVEEVYLSQKEVDLIRNVELDTGSKLDLARDLFLIGCHTALRYSDIVRIRKEHMRQNDESGYYNIEINTKKTGTKVIIPVSPRLLAILQKYGFNVPKMPEQKLNGHIKDIARRAGITGEVIIHEIKGGRKVSRKVPRSKMIKTHTARRTAATLMYEGGIPSLDIMRITGHKKETTFLNYIKTTKRQSADRLHNHPYFNEVNHLRVAK